MKQNFPMRLVKGPPPQKKKDRKKQQPHCDLPAFFRSIVDAFDIKVRVHVG